MLAYNEGTKTIALLFLGLGMYAQDTLRIETKGITHKIPYDKIIATSTDTLYDAVMTNTTYEKDGRVFTVVVCDDQGVKAYKIFAHLD